MENNRHKSICPYCGVGCGLDVNVVNNRIAEVKGLKGYPVNDGDICALAYDLPEVINAEGRLKKPLVRKEKGLTEVGWDEAVSFAAGKLNDIISKYGPNAVAFYGGASNTIEEYYLMNKLMKGLIGTNNVECSTRLCMSSTSIGLVSTIGTDAPPCCYADIELADLFFIAGNNMAVSLPIIFKRVQNQKEKGAKVIVVDPRKSQTAAIADMHIQIRPGTDVALNNAIAHVLLKDGYVDEKSVELYCAGLADLKKHLEAWHPERAAKITNVPKEQIIEAAHAIGKAKSMLTFWFQGYNHSSQAVFKNNTLHNISLLSGNFSRPGAGPLTINGEANALGNRWVGALSTLLPGMRSVLNYEHREEVANYWNTQVDKISPTPGLSIIDTIKGLHSGEVRALWVCATNPAVSLPNANWVEEGLKKADLLIVQDIFHPTETSLLANVVFPATQWGEKTGIFITSERRAELIEKIVDIEGDAKPDYEIIQMVANAMGFKEEFAYNSPEEVFEEFKGLTINRICDMGGVTYDRLRAETGPQLPCPALDHKGTPRLFNDYNFPRLDGRAALLARNYIEPAELPNEKFPFILLTGKSAAHFNTRTRTGRLQHSKNNSKTNYISINPVDAKRMGIAENDKVEAESKRGKVKGVARVLDKTREGVIFMNMHYGDLLGVGKGMLANLVTNNACDMHSKQPELKFCAVNISKIKN